MAETSKTVRIILYGTHNLTKSHDRMNVNTKPSAAQLRTAVMRLARELRIGMQHDGLPLAMLSILAHLQRSGSMTPTDLARRESVKLQTLSRLLAELEVQGWIERSAVPTDARQSLLEITTLGKKRLGMAAEGADLPLSQVISTRLSSKDQAVLLNACELLETLSDALKNLKGTA